MDSKLQIISGKYKGRHLSVPKNARPTQNMARIALFNMLESGIINNENLVVWDAFAGSGALGLECVSRYPSARVIFTDVAGESVKTIRKNLSDLNVGTTAQAVQLDAVSAVKQYAPVSNLVFVDAPYSVADLGRAVIRQLGQMAQIGTVVVWEQEKNNSVDADLEKWDVLRDKTYGRARFLILQKK